ncbi:MAG: esterase/lipase family protein [Chromatocurvus sp.]
MTESTPTFAAPGSIKAFLEMRALPEYFAAVSCSSLLRLAPKGDGHVVVVIPGFLGGKYSTLRLRKVLIRLGYHTFDWRLGVNRGPVGGMEDALLKQVVALHARTGRKVSLIGWSLGGVYARVLAHKAPELLRTVITLGSPIRFPHESAADSLYQWITGEAEPPEALQNISKAAAIPTTAIHSRMDGVVNWRACLAQEAANSENIAVMGSHCGLGHHPLVSIIIAERLAQDPESWRRFRWQNILPVAARARQRQVVT